MAGFNYYSRKLYAMEQQRKALALVVYYAVDPEQREKAMRELARLEKLLKKATQPDPRIRH